MRYKVFWDISGDDGIDVDPPDLPAVVDVPDDVGVEGAADWMSDRHGWLVSSLEPVDAQETHKAVTTGRFSSTGPNESARPRSSRMKITDDAQRALWRLFKLHGRCWKQHLRYSWETGSYDYDDDAGHLQRLRNDQGGGPLWLIRYRLPKTYGFTSRIS